MKPRLVALFVFLFVLGGVATACTDDSVSPAPDVGSDASGAQDEDVGEEDSGDDEEGDAGEDESDADGGLDAGEEPDVGEEPDADDEEPLEPYEGRPLGQCTPETSCPEEGDTFCSQALPGGACVGCGDDTHCPGSTVCNNFGSCVEECSVKEDCAPGLQCLGSGQCAAMPCVNDECPVPLFGCSDSDLCARIECDADSDVCPDDTTCVDGWCVEDRARNSEQP